MSARDATLQSVLAPLGLPQAETTDLVGRGDRRDGMAQAASLRIAASLA